MISKVPATLMASAVLAFACGPRARNEMRDEPTRASVRTTDSAPLAPALDVSVGTDVRFAFAVTNASKKKVEVMFADGRTHDVVVLDSLGREVWRWSEGRMFTQVVQSRALRTSDALQFEDAWDSPAPGRYTAVATLESRNYPVRHAVDFVVSAVR